MAQPSTWRWFVKRLVNLTHRSQSSRGNGIDKASPEASGSELPVKKIEGLYSKDFLNREARR